MLNATARALFVGLAASAAACNGAPTPGHAAAAATLSAGNATNTPARLPADPQLAWTHFAAQYVEDTFRAEPFFAAKAGRHEFDGKMPDWSAAGLAKKVEFLKSTRQQAQGFDSAALTEAQRFERDYLLSVVDGELFWIERARAPFTNPAWYVDRLDPDVYLSREYAPLAARMKAYIAYANAIPRVAAEIRANLHAPLAKPLLERGVAAFGGFAEFFRHDISKVFASVRDPAAQQELAQANAAAAQAMDGLKGWLESERKNATDAYALGPTLYADMLKSTERVDVPLDQLMAIGRADLERNLHALQLACAQYLPQGSLRDCTLKMQADKPAGGSVEAAHRQLTELKSFIIARRIVTIPGNEQALVAEAPPYNRGNFAYIQTPGPYDKGVSSTYYIAPPDPSWTAAEQAAYIPGRADLLYTSVHEVWPGHFLQFLHANRNPSMIAALWVGYAYAEGWAHYCEEMMWEEGLSQGDPAGRVGQLANALLRDARFISAIGLHTQGMTVAQSERLFLDSAFASVGDARQQAARGTYDPAYLNYTLGKLMIRKLRDDWVARQTSAGQSADPKAQWEAFHDRFLSYGGPPIPLVRKAMLGEAGSLF
jgi:uncharacterized protein (DUF885 family)